MLTQPLLASAALLLAACSSAPSAETRPEPAPTAISVRVPLERVLAQVSGPSAAAAGRELVTLQAERAEAEVVLRMDLELHGRDPLQVGERFDELLAALRALRGVREVTLARTLELDPTRLSVSGLTVTLAPVPPVRDAGESPEAREIETALRALATHRDVRVGAIAVVRRDGEDAHLRVRPMQRDGALPLDTLVRFLDGVELELQDATVVGMSLTLARPEPADEVAAPQLFHWEIEVERDA